MDPQSGLLGLILHFLTDSFDLIFIAKKGVLSSALKMGGTAVLL